ncbi:Hypothetical_protein [Hexamita inflata]|uniref:Hypothetical_protein n=1 Tax=Hexamita inflata TaxID=28002 RepID=A0AA86N4Y3_9EUKA|nr:Hypothetical protein HINF_LOCUS455 [Hexamita inflata]
MLSNKFQQVPTIIRSNKNGWFIRVMLTLNLSFSLDSVKIFHIALQVQSKSQQCSLDHIIDIQYYTCSFSQAQYHYHKWINFCFLNQFVLIQEMQSDRFIVQQLVNHVLFINQMLYCYKVTLTLGLSEQYFTYEVKS